jgi:biotin carboxylase
MKKDAVWLISGGPMQEIAGQRIRQRGLSLIVSDGNRDARCRGIADLFLHLDTFDVDGHIAAAAAALEAFNIVAVVTTGADCHYTVNRLAQHLGLSHLSPTISEACRNKAATRRLLTAAGLDQPQFHEARTFEEAVQLLGRAESDYVIKATDNSGSRGFSVIPKGVAITRSQYESARSMGTTGRVILEERLRPNPAQVSEASVETLWQDGKMYWINWVDRIFPRDLKFFPQLQLKSIPKESVEIGHINPSHRTKGEKDAVRRDIERAGAALGMREAAGAHILKADMFFSDRGPIILELTPRTSGGWDSSGSSLVRGAEIADGVVHMAMGRRVDLESWHNYFAFKYPEIISVVVSKIPEDAEDCLGRQFALAFGHESLDTVFSQALENLHQDEFYVPVL